MKPLILRSAALALPVLFSGCSMLLSLSVPTDSSFALIQGAKRANVITALGKPRASTPIFPPGPAPSVPDGWQPAKVSLCDEYKVSGLLLMPDEAGSYQNQWSIYPAVLLLTAGLTEVVALPATAGDLALRSTRRYRLRLWYDRAQKLASYDKH